VKLFDKLIGKKQAQVALHTGPLTEPVIQQWLVNRIAGIAQIPSEQVDVELPFAEFGLDSIQLFEISGDLQKFLGQEISEIIAWDYPTITKLSRYLSSPGAEVPASATMVPQGESNW
jgi:acyl carrier protein